MGRRKKSEIEAESSAQSNLIVCPICGKEFRPAEKFDSKMALLFTYYVTWIEVIF